MGPDCMRMESGCRSSLPLPQLGQRVRSMPERWRKSSCQVSGGLGGSDVGLLSRVSGRSSWRSLRATSSLVLTLQAAMSP